MRAGSHIPIHEQSDVEFARTAARRLTGSMGLDRVTAEQIVLATMELASNLLRYAVAGELTLTPIEDGGREGIEVRSTDRGPGITDPARALEDGFSTGGGLGGGLPAVRRLMDWFDLQTGPAGTTITARKWRP